MAGILPYDFDVAADNRAYAELRREMLTPDLELDSVLGSVLVEVSVDAADSHDPEDAGLSPEWVWDEEAGGFFCRPEGQS